MANDFQAVKPILLQPASVANAYMFSFEPASSPTSTGSIPYGTLVSSVAVSASFAETGADVTSELINGTPTVSSNVVTVKLDYPSITGEGKYHLRFILTLDDGSIWEKDHTSIEAENI